MKSCIPCTRLAVLPFLPLALSCAFPAFPALAQSAAPTVVLSERVVTASRVATPITDVIADVSVIDRVQLEQAGQSSLRDVLASQAGVQIAPSGSYRSNTGLFLRGASSSQTLVLVDGMRVGSATSGGAALENLPLERVERIEILRGAASALYGPDAVGGVIQIFTRAPSKNLEALTNIGLGSDGQKQAGASIRGSTGADGTTGAIGYSLGVSREMATGISAIATPASLYYNPDQDGFDATSVDAKLSARIHRDHSLRLALLRSDTNYTLDATPFPNPLGLTALTADARAKSGLNNATLQWSAQWQQAWRSTLTLGHSEDQSLGDYFRISDGASGGATRFNTRRSQVSWQNDISLDKDVLSLILENRNESVDSNTAYTETSRDVRSALVSYAFNRPVWNVLAVVRNDDNSQFGNVNNWSLSGGYRITNALRAVASAGSSFQAPSFNQLYYPSFGNPALQPQRNRASEAGLKYQRDNVSLGAVVYHNDIQGFIVPSTNVQSSRAALRGVTLTGDVQLDHTSLSLAYDYADPRSYSSNSSVSAQDDLRLVRIAHHVLNARVTRQLDAAVSVFGELRLSTDREDNNLAFSGRDLLPGYTLLNVGANWKLRKDLSLLARANNLTDAQYMLANGFSMPGRNLFVSLNWNL
ncbi:MAG: TonB-dependent receptor [Rhodoferax sp.]|nr:TonB-dependent receptor [Rhodoferax sp.]